MKTTMYPAISLDGFIATKNGNSDWVDPKDEARYEAEVEKCGCVLTGRITFDQYKDDFLSKDAVTFVCTRDKKRQDTDKVKFLSGSPEEILKKIEESGFSKIIICGGGEINGLFASVGLVNEIFISVCPRVLGEGIPLFGSFKPKLKLELLSTNEDIPGITQNYYRVIN